MWPDNETEVDLLGFQVHCDLISGLVTDASLLPVTVGIFGDWGSGKSSIMRMLIRDLGGREDVACVYFNGWQFEGYDDAKAALIETVLREVPKHRRVGEKIREEAQSLLSRVNWLRLAQVAYKNVAVPLATPWIMGMLGMPTTVAPTLASVATSAATMAATADPTALVKAQAQEEESLGVRGFREGFEELIGQTGLKSLVVLIDDLDRCAPDRLIETLEAVKLFLAVPHVAFVIGADERIVRHAIARRYGGGQLETGDSRSPEGHDLVTDYLEKLIQIPYHLPRLSPSEVETYISMLLCQRHVPDRFSVILKACRECRASDVSSVFGREQIRKALETTGLPPELEAELEWCSRISPSLSDVLKGNPRQTKRLLNSLLLRRGLASAAHLEISDQVLVKLMLLQYIQPDLFGQLFGWQAGQQGTPEELRALEHGIEGPDRDLAERAQTLLQENSAWGGPAVRTWLAMPPSLAEEDLRDYFWITRDRLTTILSGVSLVSPNLRRIVADLLDATPGALGELRDQIEQLSAGDHSVLLQELARQMRREPDPTHLIDIFIDLAQIIPSGGQYMLAALDELPPSCIPAPTPMKLVEEAQRNHDLAAPVRKLLGQWEQGGPTVLGNAAKEALLDLRRGAE